MKDIFIGNTKVINSQQKITGGFVEIENEQFYKIENYHQMPDFFITVVSDSNHWMYISSTGSLTAGRVNRDNALFPYYTDDKIHDYRGKTGSKTICLAESQGKTILWEPFSEQSENIFNIERNLYKNACSNKIIFEEINRDLGVGFRYGWYNSDKFGWIKKSSIKNIGDNDVKLSILDGIQNILPFGIDYGFQNEYSNLSNAYKKNELLKNSHLGLYMLSSIPVDKAEPSEALKANSVWSIIDDAKAKYLISEKQVPNFKRGLEVYTEYDVRASKGAYFVNSEFSLKPKEDKTWYFVAEVNRDATDVANLNHFLTTQHDLKSQIEADISIHTTLLTKIVANADGLQMGNEVLSCSRHMGNTLYNIMRGGTFAHDYIIEKKYLIEHFQTMNKDIEKVISNRIAELPDEMQYSHLLKWSESFKNLDIERLCQEFLPLTFSRRHGDPSRPWNQFAIENKNNDGTPKLSYQGNWRDIFQNWEALVLSFPEYTESIIGKFLNATTADGYNPYRITNKGIDWESPEPNDPWAYIGYWGDHQIIYLQKLLEQSENFHPDKLDQLLSKELFVYANVPYRIKPFSKIVENAKNTIDFDFELNDDISVLANKIGADGKLLRSSENKLCRANMMEKIMVTLLAKLNNFIPEAGIWLTTQRPEWNDANNALVGNGVSMVTLFHIRRFLKFWEEKLENTTVKEVKIADELKTHYDTILKLFTDNTHLLKTGFSDNERYSFTTEIGEAGSIYRNSIYQNGFSGNKTSLPISEFQKFVNITIKYIDQSIEKNKREDGMYHSYNLISIKNNTISIRYLYEMLEGQVAVLSSGVLSVEESLEVLEGLKKSKMFDPRQYSYTLYPNRELARFIDKNNIPKERVEESKILKKLLADNDKSILTRDNTGDYHFNGTFRNVDMLKEALSKLGAEYQNLVEESAKQIEDIYEEVFDHQSFTGRSGTFYGYEGLGSIYWHMVSKLLLAVQEVYINAEETMADTATVGRLKDHYYEIKAGIGLYKSPELYGAFPTDAYSHTPLNMGVQQPGLTGQVKEDIISRFGELGVRLHKGQISFAPSLMSEKEFLKQKTEFSYFNIAGDKQKIALSENQMVFTFCQVPIVYSIGSSNEINISNKDGHIHKLNGLTISSEFSNLIFNRTAEITKIEVAFQG